jgi:hypothetical protein
MFPLLAVALVQINFTQHDLFGGTHNLHGIAALNAKSRAENCVTSHQLVQRLL